MFSSLPMALVERFHKVATKDVFEKDKPVLDGLEKAGFKLNRFESGLFMKLFKEGGGYYRACLCKGFSFKRAARPQITSRCSC